MMSDLLNDNFDPSLEKYRREALKPDSEIHTHDDISTALVARFSTRRFANAFAQLWEQYTNYKRPQLAPSTITKDFDRVSIHIDRFPDVTLDGAVAVRDYLNLKTTPNTTKRVLTQLGACCQF
jgi:integrase